MTKEFAEQYFEWLVDNIEIGPTRQAFSFNGLFRALHAKEFVWVIANDDNRIGDALELRREFWRPGNQIPRTPVSILEVIVALSRRVAFNASGEENKWAWQLIVNLGLDNMPDPFGRRKAEKTEEILEALVWRTYEPNGVGGLFPLRIMESDQTRTEIWYQMSAYINQLANQ